MASDLRRCRSVAWRSSQKVRSLREVGSLGRQNWRMASGGTLVGEWSRAAKSALVAAGWTKRGGADIFMRAVDGDTLAWVGLNRATKYKPIVIWPIAGVRHEPTMRLIDALMGSSDAVAPTLCHPLRYLGASEEKALQVGDQLDIEGAVKELVSLVNRFAVPFALSLQDPDRQLEAHSARMWLPVPEYAIARRPAMLAVLGRRAEAMLALDEELATLGARSDAAAEHYRSFGSALRKHLGD
jgi:hypothetical protein